jgi:hypothetical protein
MAKTNKIKYEYYELPNNGQFPLGVSVTLLRGGFGSENPKSYMDLAVSDFLEKKGRPIYNEFIEIYLDNPYLRVIVTGINDMPFQSSDCL